MVAQPSASPEVVLIACSTEANITAWDPSTGTQLTQYKANASPRNGICVVGRDYLASAQTAKDAVHFWAWHKDQVLQRSFCQERVTALAASRDGMYLAGGGTSGTLYLWSAASGQLLRTWPAHYKAVSVLAFLEGGTVLVSGGEDTLVQAWLLASVLDVAADRSAHVRVEPMHSWSEHTLPITSIHCGLGEANAIIATASLDRTAKIWSLASGALLRSVTLPAGVTAVTLDAGEHAMYAGTSDGTIFEVALVGGGDASSDSDRQQAAAAAGPGPSSVAQQQLLQAQRLQRQQDAAQGRVRMEGHGAAVSSLGVSLDGERLISGSEDGTVRIWDLRSRQCVRIIASPSKAPISCALLVQWPEHLAGIGAATAGASGRQGPKRAQPLAPLAKFPAASGMRQPWEGAPVVLEGSCPVMGIGQGSGLLGVLGVPAGGRGQGGSTVDQVWSVQQGLQRSGQRADGAADAGGAAVGDGQAVQQEEVADLKRQLAEAQQAVKQWQGLHAELHEFASQQLLGK